MQKISQSSSKSLTNLFNAFKSGDIGSFADSLKDVGSNAKDILPNIGKMATTLVNPWTLAATAIVGGGTALINYNKNLEETLMRTEQFTGLSGNSLMSLRNGIKSVADTFGKDFNDILSSVDGLMSQFGISGEEALSIIKDGFVGGCDDGGKMFDLISKYSGAFKDAGISASEMVAIIGNTRSGIFNEQGMDLIAKGSAKIRKFGTDVQTALQSIGVDSDEMQRKLQNGETTTIQALQSISSKLSTLNPQSKEVGVVLQSIFEEQGAMAGYELVTALADVETSLDNVKKQTGSWGEAMEQLQESDRELENALSSLFHISDGGFSTMTTRLKADIYGGIAKVINAFIDLYNKNIMVRYAIEQIAFTFKTAWEIIKDILKIFSYKLQAIAEMIQGVLTLDWDQVKNGWEKGVKNILTTVADGFNKIKEEAIKSSNNVLNGQIEKVVIETETTTTSNNNNFSSNKGRSKTDKPTSSSKAITKEIKYALGSIKEYEEKLSKLNDELNNTNVSNERLQEILFEKDVIEEQIKALKERNGLLNVDKEIKYKVGSLADIQKQLQEAQAKIKLEIVGSERYNELAKLISDLTGKENVIKLQMESDTLDEATRKTNELKKAQEEAQRIAELNKQGYDALSSTFGNLGQAIGGTAGSFLQFTAQSIQAISQVIPQIVSLIAAKQGEALASGTASAAAMPFPANIAAMASIIATITGLFASFAGSFADGGIIGGQTTIGDFNLARVNKGEMILNSRQQGKLFSMLNNSGYYSNNENGGSVTFKIHGKDLVGTLSNYNKKTSKAL